MKASAALLAVAVLAAACSSDGSEKAVVVRSDPGGVAAVDADPEPSPEAELAHCDDIPRLRSRLEGKLSGRRNPDHIVEGVLLTYAMEHPDTFGGRWIDRDSGGVLVMGFTDDPEPHRAAILARHPSPDDYPAVDPPPPITDDRPLGERVDVVIDVLQVRFSEREADATHDELMEVMSREDWWRLGLDGSWYDIHRQRVGLGLVNPPEGALAEIAARVPDPSALCVEITRTPQPPSGPLDVIPDLDVEDPLVSCPGTPAVRYSQMIAPPSIDEVDHPAVDALRAELDAPGGEPLPRGRWVVLSIDNDSATFAALSDYSFGVAGVERRGDRWIFAGEASGRPCEPTVPLPPGLAHVDLHLDINSMPDAADTTIDLLVTEQGCASGREMGDALRGPQVIETDDAVVLAFAVVPIAGSANCPGNPSATVTVELSEPLGQRWVYDGLHFPPKPLFAVADPATSTGFRDSFTCRAGSAFAARIRSDAEGADASETANEALLEHLGDLSEPLYDIEVAERGYGYEQWRVAVEDSEGEAHFGTVRAVSTAEGLWRIEQARWCLTTVGNRDTVWRGAALKHGDSQPPADFSDCPMRSEMAYEVPEPLEEGLPTPGVVLREDLSPLPTSSYTVRVAESTDRMVRWEITVTGPPTGLTFGKKIAIEDNGWRMRTAEWCHMEPDRL